MFGSAVRVFNQLAHANLACGVTLLGFTVVGKVVVGKKSWNAPLEATDNPANWKDLKQFQGFPNPQDFTLSALVEICEEDTDSVLHGSPILLSQWTEQPSPRLDMIEEDGQASRAPCVLIQGREADRVGTALVTSHSAYIGALFDNFD